MKTYITKFADADSDTISIYFSCEQDNIMAIGDKMNGLNEMAYMNGYNWGAFFAAYLKVHEPALLVDLESDPEAGGYVAYYPQNSANSVKADKFIAIIEHLIENQDELYEFLTENSNEIEWD
ncbi:Imm51 family immunity protein [Hymenobacter baengnokdamensis]|uniref:Imm51 family immunity protein n=1 Tax=Hymenobacter baengnokdamensis TaxID=2615203 RepID=UPI0012456E08|nr:Imm51 family immunity protein [Hymenobacter baengnokdamensis]